MKFLCKKKNRVISALLMIILLFNSTSVLSFGAEFTDDFFPEGFTEGQTGNKNWAYKDTETYVAVLMEKEDGEYLLAYASKVNNDIYEVRLSAKDFGKANRLISTLEEGNTVQTAQMVVAPQPEPIEQAATFSTNHYDPYMNEIEAMMQEEYGAPTNNREVYWDYDWSYNPIELLCTYKISESMYYGCEVTGARFRIQVGWDLATAAAFVAAEMGSPTGVVLDFLLTVSDIYGWDDMIMEELTTARYRGSVAYARTGSAQTTGEPERFYNVVSTKTIVNYYTVIEFNSDNIHDEIRLDESETIYAPSEYEASYSYMIQQVRTLHS